MDSTQVFTAGQEGLYMLLLVSAPILVGILVVGLVVSIFQAATQINEATLSFVPKLVAAGAIFALAGPWMLTSLVEYLQRECCNRFRRSSDDRGIPANSASLPTVAC